jgi:hypothetical protein
VTYAALDISGFLTGSALLATGALSGCARMPTVFSDDGATLSFEGKKLEYRVPGQTKVSCKFDGRQKLVVCDNGLASDLIVARLPFRGVLLVEFDGRQFKPAKRP